jgi:hypothetical protein
MGSPPPSIILIHIVEYDIINIQICVCGLKSHQKVSEVVIFKLILGEHTTTSPRFGYATTHENFSPL